jgi:hypothetical protein
MSSNPMWDEGKKYLNLNYKDPLYLRAFQVRREYCSLYAWAIADPEAVAFVAEQTAKIVEMGAGTGYWAGQLAQAGVDVVASIR